MSLAEARVDLAVAGQVRGVEPGAVRFRGAGRSGELRGGRRGRITGGWSGDDVEEEDGAFAD